MPPPSLEKGQQPTPAKAPRLPRPFVLLNIPKTGTTYATRYVRNADLLSVASLFGMMRILQHSPICIKQWGWKIQTRRKPGRPHGHMNFNEQHTPYSWLPAQLQALPAVTILREPVSWYLSDYLYHTRAGLDYRQRLLKLQSPEYKSFVQKYMGGEVSRSAWCNISLEGFGHFRRDIRRHWRVHDSSNSTLVADFPIGALGCQALTYLHREPARVFAMRTEEVEEYFISGRWHQDLCQVYSLRHEQLQEDLYRVMLEHLGYRREILDAAREITPPRPNAAPSRHKELALRELEQKPWLREEILQGERIYSQYILPLAGAPK